MKILLLCDDYWHPGGVPVEGVEPLKQKGFEFDIIKNANEFSPDQLTQYPAVLLVKSDEISQEDKQPWKTEEVQKAFVDYVESGGGLVAVHSATVPSRISPVMEELMGCRFTGHPNACLVTVGSVKTHPVTEGVGMFCETDEHYQMEIIKNDADVIAASYSPPQGDESKYGEDPYHNCPASICAAAIVRTQGKGRVCVLTPGHFLPVWLNPEFQKMLVNALKWVKK